MNYSYTSFYCAKQPNNCEDAFYSSLDKQTGKLEELKDRPIRFAIADGVSNSESSGGWAQILTKKYCEDGEDNLYKNIIKFGKLWIAHLISYYNELTPKIKERIKSEYDVSFEYDTENHLDRLTKENDYDEWPSSTLLGFEVVNSCKWKVISIGDSCLFQIRKVGDNKECILSHPENPQFGVHPNQISTNWLKVENPDNENHLQKIKNCQMGDLLDGDIFFLMTDKLAEWFTDKNKDNQVNKIQRLLNIQNNEEFIQFGREEVWPDYDMDDLTLTTLYFYNNEEKKPTVIAPLSKLTSPIPWPPDIPIIFILNERFHFGETISVVLLNLPLPSDLKNKMLELGAIEEKPKSNNDDFEFYIDSNIIPPNNIKIKKSEFSGRINVNVIEIDTSHLQGLKMGEHKIWVKSKRMGGSFESKHSTVFIEAVDRV